MKTQLMNYDLIQEFNEQKYSNLLFPANVSDDEMFITKYLDEDGDEQEFNKFFFPLKKNNLNYLLPSEYLNKLPIKVIAWEKISVAKKAYHLITNAEPAGFGPMKTFPEVKDFVLSFCNYAHSSNVDFLLWKLVCLSAYLKRVNVRVASDPAFGKDSLLRVLKSLVGDVGIVHNPSVAKIEYLLTNKVIMTNEVAGIKSEDIDALSQYYLTCGDFSNVYEKRTVANYVGSFNTYNIQKLSNVVCYNTIDCYTERQKEKYFEKMFQRAVQERFLPLKFSGKIEEKFGAIIGAHDIVANNIDYYKNIVKMLKYLELHFEKEIHHYVRKERGFKDRALRNWETICLMIDLYSSSQEEYDILCDELYRRYEAYLEHVGLKSSFTVNSTNVKEYEISMFNKFEKEIL